jgi:MscS family membrane protein
MKVYAIAIIIFLSHTLGFSQETTFNLNSPYQTILTHVSYLEQDNYKPDVAANVFNPNNLKDRNPADLAVKLMQVYKGAGINIDFEVIPSDNDYTDSLTGRQVYYVTKKYPQIYLEKVGERWYYSAETVREIERLHAEVYPFGAGKLLELLPKLGNNKYLGLYLWQIIGILILVFTVFIIHKLFTFILEKVIIKILIVKGHVKIAGNYVLPVARPLSILIIFPILMIFVPVLQLPITVNSYTILILKALWPLFAALVGYKFVDLLSLYLMKLADKTENTLDDQLVPLARKALKVFVVIIGVLAIMANLDIDILPLLTGLSIGGLAFALAAQDTIKNFFGSIMIFLDKPFQIGDWITSGEIDGTVEEVGFRATRVRTNRNSVTYVPNGMLADKTVDNLGLRKFRRFSTKLTIHYDTTPALIETFVKDVQQVVVDHPNTVKDNWQVYLNDFGDSALVVLFTAFLEVPTLADELRCRQELILEIIKTADRLGVKFAYPTRTLYMETDQSAKLKA